MGEVIGYKGSKRERLINWFTMREIRESVKHYKTLEDRKYKRVAEHQDATYKSFVEEYVKAA